MHKHGQTLNVSEKAFQDDDNRVQLYDWYHTKRRLGRVGASHAFFWYDNKKDLKTLLHDAAPVQIPSHIKTRLLPCSKSFLSAALFLPVNTVEHETFACMKCSRIRQIHVHFMHVNIVAVIK